MRFTAILFILTTIFSSVHGAAAPAWETDLLKARDKQDNGKLPPIDGQFCDLAMPLTKRLKP